MKRTYIILFFLIVFLLLSNNEVLAQGDRVFELRTQINEILTKIRGLQSSLQLMLARADVSGIPSSFSFNTDLKKGDDSLEVKYL